VSADDQGLEAKRGSDPVAASMPAEHVSAFALSDAYETLARCFEALPETGEAELETIELILAAARDQKLDVVSAAEAVGRPLDCSIAAGLLRVYLQLWDQGGRDAIPFLTGLVDVRKLEPAGEDRDLLFRLFEAAEELSLLDDVLEDESGAAGAAGAFRRLSTETERRGDAEHAVAAALSAMNLAGRSKAVAESADLVLRMLDPDGDPMIRTRVETRKVLSLIAHTGDPEATVRAFDSGESLIRFLDVPPDDREEIAATLIPALNEVAVLRPLAHMLATEQLPEEDPAKTAVLRLLGKRTWDATVDLSGISIEQIAGIAIAVENQRWGVEPPPAAVPEAHWSTWSFDYPPFGRAVPNGESMSHDEDPDGTRLTLAHETIHVLCMGGDLGLILTALRLALFEVEVRLWSFGEPVDEDGFRAEVAPLTIGDLAPMAQAEQALELGRKVQALEDVWAPWLEGIAVYGEMAAADEADEVVTPVTQVLANLISDEPPQVESARRHVPVGEIPRARQDKADRLFREAGTRSGRQRLRAAIGGQYAHKYLAGYLAVRSVVAAWRRSVGEGLTAQMAFRLLLHATRFGTIEAVPDLAAPAAGFGTEAVERMAAWVRGLQNLDPSSLRKLAWEGHQMGGTCWRGGKLVATDAEDADAVAVLEPMVERALMTLTGDEADLHRAPGADTETAALMEAFAGALEVQDWSIKRFYPELPATYLGRLGILPLAKFRAPFWLVKPDGYLIFLLRTGDPEGGPPQHQLLRSRLTPEQVDSLEAERSRLREARLNVFRVADLTHASYEPELRGGGLNYFAFTYGDWIHLEGRGLLTEVDYVGRSVAAEIQARLSPNPLLDFESTWTAGGKAGAERTANWLAVSEEWTLDGQRFWPGALVDRIGRLADEVLDRENHPDAPLAAERLLGMVTGPEVAARLQREGLEILRDIDPEYTSEVVRALADSALAPVANPFLDQHAGELSELLGELFETRNGLWDVRSTLEEP
jgi:hypothetical protein